MAQVPSIIETARLTLRPLSSGDAPALVQALSVWSVTKWLTSVPFPYSIVHAENYVRSVKKASEGTYYWAIEKDANVIGVVSIEPDLGYWLAEPYHGRRYMSEAVQAVLQAYFEVHPGPLRVSYKVGNDQSRAVLIKMGFKDTFIEDMSGFQAQHLQLTKTDFLETMRGLTLSRSLQSQNDPPFGFI
mmetsp:Transcript_12567/g.23321  ORF Transcript_12567/g.23321 Transcript_12567/m.23321 type:complete len:187 (-) Transcript_12567:200-760(-)